MSEECFPSKLIVITGNCALPGLLEFMALLGKYCGS
jgi:hypothetical protein